MDWKSRESGENANIAATVATVAGILTCIVFILIDFPKIVSVYFSQTVERDSALSHVEEDSLKYIDEFYYNDIEGEGSSHRPNRRSVTGEEHANDRDSVVAKDLEAPDPVPAGVLPVGTEIAGVTLSGFNSRQFLLERDYLFRVETGIHDPYGRELVPSNSWLILRLIGFKVPEDLQDQGWIDFEPRGLRIAGEKIPLRGEVLSFEWKFEMRRTGDGSVQAVGTGALLGGLVGYAVARERGAASGAGLGAVAGGLAAAQDIVRWIEIPEGSAVRVRLDEALDLRHVGDRP